MTRLFSQKDFEIFEHLPHPIWVFDIDKEAMWWANQHAVKLWNATSLERLIERDFSDTSEATKERLANYRRKFQKGETLVEQWTFYPKGQPCVVVCTCSGVHIEDGRIALLIEGRPISVTDIEPNTLRCVEALHHTSLVISIYSLHGELLFQNPASSRTFKPELKHFTQRFAEEELARSIWERVSEGQFVSLEAQVHTTKGIRWHGIDCKLTRDPVKGGQVVLCNQRDLHQLKVTELKLERAIVEAREMALIKSRFLANMSHEIRTPLNGVLGMAQLLAETRLSKNQSQLVGHMQDAAHILRTLIDDILDYSKLEAGRLSVNRAPFSLNKLFQTCVSLVEPQAQSKQLTFLAQNHLTSDFTLLGDEIRISQVLINILGNAVKFTQEGEVRFELFSISHSENACSLKWHISDTGIGISEEDQTKLFSRFTQLDNSLLRGQAGTGLGLAISRELIELMNGSIELTSKPNAGSCFKIHLTLPFATAPVRKSMPINGCLQILDLDILLVEDNLTNQMVAKRMVTRLGHQCRIANDGQQAIEEFKRQKPDLILMDVVMPVMDGLTATRKIRALEDKDQRTPILALTANAMREEKELYLASDMDDFIAKPLDFKVLEDMLNKWRKRMGTSVSCENTT